MSGAPPTGPSHPPRRNLHPRLLRRNRTTPNGTSHEQPAASPDRRISPRSTKGGPRWATGVGAAPTPVAHHGPPFVLRGVSLLANDPTPGCIVRGYRITVRRNLMQRENHRRHPTQRRREPTAEPHANSLPPGYDPGVESDPNRSPATNQRKHANKCRYLQPPVTCRRAPAERSSICVHHCLSRTRSGMHLWLNHFLAAHPAPTRKAHQDPLHQKLAHQPPRHHTARPVPPADPQSRHTGPETEPSERPSHPTSRRSISPIATLSHAQGFETEPSAQCFRMAECARAFPRYCAGTRVSASSASTAAPTASSVCRTSAASCASET
jgi:hypothetical protein